MSKMCFGAVEAVLRECRSRAARSWLVLVRCSPRRLRSAELSRAHLGAASAPLGAGLAALVDEALSTRKAIGNVDRFDNAHLGALAHGAASEQVAIYARQERVRGRQARWCWAGGV